MSTDFCAADRTNRAGKEQTDFVRSKTVNDHRVCRVQHLVCQVASFSFSRLPIRLAYSQLTPTRPFRSNTAGYISTAAAFHPEPANRSVHPYTSLRLVPLSPARKVRPLTSGYRNRLTMFSLTSGALVLGLAASAQARIVEHWWNITYATANPDGVSLRR